MTFSDSTSSSSGVPEDGFTIDESIKSFALGRSALFLAITTLSCDALGADPRVFQSGNLSLTPLLNVNFTDEDNIYRRNVDEVDSLITTITPSLAAVYSNGVSGWQLDLQASDVNFDASDVDDYSSWSINGSAHLELNEFNLLDFNAGLQDDVQRRGTGFSQFGPLPDEPDTFEQSTLGVTYQLGSQNARLRLRVGGNSTSMEYTNNEEFATGRNYDQTGLQSTLLWRVSPRTDILVEARTNDFEYDQALFAGGQTTASLDSSEQYVFLGVSWEATARTTGSIRIGRADKEFDSPTRQDVDGPSYEVGIEYSPLTYSTFNLTASQNYGEGIGIGNATERKLLGINWQHEWRPSLSTVVSIQSEDSDYVGSALTDNVDRLSARLNYELARWLDVNIGVSTEERETNVTQAFGFDQSGLSIGFQASF